MVTKKPAATIKTPKVAVNMDRNVFSVSYEGPSIFDNDYFEFTIDSDGDVTINDNVFSSKKQAADVLEAMAKFLRK